MYSCLVEESETMGTYNVRKAYDPVDHDLLCPMTDVHRLPIWLGKVIRKWCELEH